MANLTVKYLSDTGVLPTLDPIADLVPSVPIGSGHDTWLVLRNTNVATRTVTIVVPGNTSYGEPYPDKVLTLGATTGELWIPLRREYADPNTPGRATVTLSANTNVTGAVVQVG